MAPAPNGWAAAEFTPENGPAPLAAQLLGWTSGNSLEPEDTMPALPVLLLAALLAAPSWARAQEAADPAPAPERQAVPRGSRPQGDNPRTGTATPRSRPAPREDGAPRAEAPRRGETRGRTVVVPDRRRTVIVQPPVYGYYNPRPYGYPYYPYGYGTFGLGYLYYDPFRGYAAPSPVYNSGYYRRPFSPFDIGELRLDVSPRHAQVFVDGYYAGTVDDYDGAFQAVKLESGAYRIEISAPGYETLTFDVRIAPGQKIRYRGDLRRY